MLSRVRAAAGPLALAALMGYASVSAWRAGTYLALIATVPLGLLALWATADGLRHEAPEPGAIERYEGRMLAQVVLAFAACAGAMWLQPAVGGGAALLLFGLALACGFFWAMRLRGRSESAAAYRRRVGLRDRGER